LFVKLVFFSIRYLWVLNQELRFLIGIYNITALAIAALQYNPEYGYKLKLKDGHQNCHQYILYSPALAKVAGLPHLFFSQKKV
jgi:hypothetical protein